MTENKEEFVFSISIQTDAIISLIRSVSALVDEAIFEITSEGMSMRAVDASNASMVSLDIPKEVFIEFDIIGDTKLGIDLNRINELFGMAEKGGEVELKLDINTHKLVIDMNNLSYTMSLLDPTTLRTAPHVPELDLPAEITLSSNKFKQAIKAAGMVADNMTIGVDGKTVFMEAVGDSDTVKLELSGDDLISLNEASVSGTYSLDYLSDMSKGIGTTGEVTINLGRDLPVVIDFSPYERCDVTYLLAPRIDSD